MSIVGQHYNILILDDFQGPFQMRTSVSQAAWNAMTGSTRRQRDLANRRRQMQKKETLAVFLKLNNRKKIHTVEDFTAAGYPSVTNESHEWKKLHDLCKATFRDGHGRTTYTWFGNLFFFLIEEDANLFRTLMYIV